MGTLSTKMDGIKRDLELIKQKIGIDQNKEVDNDNQLIIPQICDKKTLENFMKMLDPNHEDFNKELPDAIRTTLFTCLVIKEGKVDSDKTAKVMANKLFSNTAMNGMTARGPSKCGKKICFKTECKRLMDIVATAPGKHNLTKQPGLEEDMRESFLNVIQKHQSNLASQTSTKNKLEMAKNNL